MSLRSATLLAFLVPSSVLGCADVEEETEEQAGALSSANLALNKAARASSIEDGTLPASAAVDGITGSRWSSAFSDAQWLEVDLGSAQTFDHVALTWETAYGKAYEIEVSTDARTWTTAARKTDGAGGKDDLRFDAVSARYVRMKGIQRGTPWGYSLYELQVFRDGGSAGPGTPLTPTVPPTKNHLFVAKNGRDTNAGTESAPFLTIQRAASLAKADTTIHVGPGTYTENVNTRTSGTSAGHLRFVSTAKWGAKIVGTNSEATFTNGGNYVDIADFDITGPGRLGILNNGSFTTISGNHVHDLKVSGGCTGSGGAGIVNANYSATDDDIIGNVVHDIGVPGACNGVQGIYHSNLRGRVLNNIVYRASSFGIHLWHAANNVVIANNTVFANGSSRMGGGIVLGTGDSPGGVVLDNTRVINNIVYANPAASITQYCYSGEACIGSRNTTDRNLVFANGSGISLRVGAATGTISADPQFVSYASSGTSGNYRLKSSSPAVDRGVALSAPSFDIDGIGRPRGGGIDLGAYESF